MPGPQKKKRPGGSPQGLRKLKKPLRVKSLFNKLDQEPAGVITSDVLDVVSEDSSEGQSSDPVPTLSSSAKQQRKSSRAKGASSLHNKPDDNQEDSDELPSTSLNSRQPGTKVKFPKKKSQRKGGSTARRQNEDREHIDLPEGTQQSVEITQGMSKIKLEDWYPFFDFEFNKQNLEVIPGVESQEEEEESEDGVGDSDTSEDEWEETLVYVDLEDVPNASELFSALALPTENDTSAAPVDEESGDGIASGGGLSHIEMKVFNMDSQLPVILLGGKYLACQWQDTLGTSLFFKKTSQDTTKGNTAATGSTAKLKNIVPEPEIPFDPVFGSSSLITTTNTTTQGNEEAVTVDGHELVAKSCKILKAKHFSVVNEENKWDDFIRDNDDEFDPRDFQIPSVDVIRKFSKEKICDYQTYLEKDLDRRRKIHEKWGKEQGGDKKGSFPAYQIKTEPADHRAESEYEQEGDTIFFEMDTEPQPRPGPSNQAPSDVH